MLGAEDEISMRKHRFSAERLIKEFTDKNWKRQTLDHFLRKMRTTTLI